MTREMATVVVLAGPTATGKSALALDLADALGGTIINADSMQVYADLRILTARPSEAATDRAPHRLYGIIPAAEACSAARWRTLAATEIRRARSAGRRPILVGGTGLYLKALMEGLSPVPAVPRHVRAEATARHAALGGERFHRELAREDPEMAARLDPGDTQRLIRAWEVLRATGRSLADWQRQSRDGTPPDFRFEVFVLDPPRDSLYQACNIRFLQMIDDGALEEVRQFARQSLDPSLPAMRALGVRELMAHLDGRYTLSDAVIRAQTATRQYAKRQVTWFRHQRPPPSAPLARWTVISAQYSESLAAEILSILCNGN